MEKQKGKYVTRAAYQKLAEENKRLLFDLKIICVGSIGDSCDVYSKWIAHFQKEADFSSALKAAAKKHFDKKDGR